MREIKKHYAKLGYKFTKMGDKFYVDVRDLTDGSQADVEIKCDYCGKVFVRKWYSYIEIKRKEIIHKDACCDCCKLKSNDSIKYKYGSHKELYYQTNEKRTETNLLKYGVNNVFSSGDIQEKIIDTNLRKYGVKYSQQNEEIRNKTRNTCYKKYGVENYVECFKGKFIGENSPCWKGGASKTRNERATHEYIEWRKSVFDRDLYICQKL